MIIYDKVVCKFEYSCTDPNSMMFLADLGSLKISRFDENSTTVKRSQQNTLLLSDQQLAELSYDRFKISMNSFMLYHSNNLTVFQTAMRYNNESLKRDIVVDKIDFDFFLDKSIVPVVNTPGRADIKISGSIPRVVLRFSDLRYKHLMELLDLYFPSSPIVAKLPSEFQIDVLKRYSATSIEDSERDIKTFFAEAPEENNYNSIRSEYFDAKSRAASPSSPSTALDIQRFQIDVTINQMHILAFKETVDSSDMVLYADAGIQNLRVFLLQRSFDLKVILDLGTFVIVDELVETTSKDRIFFKSDEGSADEHFLHLEYLKVDLNSPELGPLYKNIDQNIKIDLSSMNVFLRDKTLISFQNYIVNTFKKDVSAKISSDSSLPAESTIVESTPDSSSNRDISIKFYLKAVTFQTSHEDYTFGTATLKSGSVNMVLGSDMNISGKLRDLNIYDNMNQLSFCRIQGEQVFDFHYQTFAPGLKDHDAFLSVRSGSLVLTYQPSFIIRLQMYLAELQRYQIASQLNDIIVKQNTSSGFMKFDIFVRTPIIELARTLDGNTVKDPNNLYLKFQLGSIHMKNNQVKVANFLDDMRLSVRISEINLSDSKGNNVIEPIDVDLSIFNCTEWERRRKPSISIKGNVSKASAQLDDFQYRLLVDSLRYFLDTVIQIFPPSQQDDDPGLLSSPETVASTASSKRTGSSGALLQDRMFKMDLRLDLCGFEILLLKQGTGHFCRLALNEINVKFCNFVDESMEVDVKVHSFAIEDIRSDLKRVYRNLLPPQTFDDGQLHIHYAKTEVGSQMLKMSLDSPKVILILDLVFALRDFFSNLPPVVVAPILRQTSKPTQETERVISNSMFLMINVIDAEISILENPESSKSEAIVLKFKKLLFSHQGNTSLSMDGVGMFLCNMDSKNDLNLRFVDDFDLSLTIEKSNMWLRCTPIILRISYQDVLFVTSVISNFNKYSGRAASNDVTIDVAALQLKASNSTAGPISIDTSLKTPNNLSKMVNTAVSWKIAN